MAIIQQDPRLKKDQDEQQQQGPITGTSGAPTQSQEAPQDSQQPPQPVQAQQAPQTQRGSAPSSGMATNVNQYVQKNQPQAQKMAQAVTKDISQQTGQIAQQAQQRQKALQQQLQAGQQKVTAAKGFAQEQIQNILNPQTPAPAPQAPAVQQQPDATQQVLSQLKPEGEAPVAEPQGYTPSEEASARFQELLKGNVGVERAQNINLTPQQQRLESLKNLAGGIGTEQGRQAALKGTFGDGREYTSGQSTLDELILGGTPDARQALVSGAEQAYSGAEGQLTDIQTQSAEDIKAQEAMLGALPEEIQQMSTGATTGVLSEVDQSVADLLAQRQDLAGQLTPEMQALQEQMSAYGQKTDAEILEQLLGAGQSGRRSAILDPKNMYSQLSKFIPKELQDQLNTSYKESKSRYGTPRRTLTGVTGSTEAMDQLKQLYADKILSGQVAGGSLYSAKGKYVEPWIQNTLRNIGAGDKKMLDEFGIGSSYYRGAVHGRSGRTKSADLRSMLNIAKGIRDKSKAFSMDDVIKKSFADTGMLPEQVDEYLAGSDITRGSLLKEDAIKRTQLENLARLTGDTSNQELLASGDKRLVTDEQSVFQKVLDSIKARQGVS